MRGLFVSLPYRRLFANLGFTTLVLPIGRITTSSYLLYSKVRILSLHTSRPSIGLFYLSLGCPSSSDLLSDFCSSQPNFAICFLQISPHGEHPCIG
jgi:hypothetical protein